MKDTRVSLSFCLPLLIFALPQIRGRKERFGLHNFEKRRSTLSTSFSIRVGAQSTGANFFWRAATGFCCQKHKGPRRNKQSPHSSTQRGKEHGCLQALLSVFIVDSQALLNFLTSSKSQLSDGTTFDLAEVHQITSSFHLQPPPLP